MREVEQPLATEPLVLQSWNTSERRLASGGFESTQRVLASEPVVESSSRVLAGSGWRTGRRSNRATRGGVRARWTNDGGRLTLLGGASLLSFGAPELAFTGEAVSCRYTVEGGLLALRAGGSVTLAQRHADGEVELSVIVEDYLPRLAARTRRTR